MPPMVARRSYGIIPDGSRRATASSARADPASVVGVLAIVAEPDVLTHEERTLADAIVSEGELALDRARAMEAREEAAVLAKKRTAARQPAALHLA